MSGSRITEIKRRANAGLSTTSSSVCWQARWKVRVRHPVFIFDGKTIFFMALDAASYLISTILSSRFSILRPSLGATLMFLVLVPGCMSNPASDGQLGAVLDIPFIKNTPDECYFLDEFMPVPDRMVPGRSGRLALRYYTYNMATYKDWDRKKITLSFYSDDNLCWHLFEEYYMAK